MIAAFLIRCSTKKQDYQRQVNDLTRLANRLGYEYSDKTIYGEHITGKDDATIRDRDSIARLKADAVAGKFHVVLVSEVSRMSRDPISGRWYVRELINWQIPVYFKDIDTWTFEPNTKQVTSKIRETEAIIGAAFDAAWKYLKSMKTQIASGRRNELDNSCISVGKPFFGYKRHGGKDKAVKNSLVLDQENADIAADVFNEYLKDGATLRSTTFAINAKYGRRFSQAAINHILNYEPYATGIKVFTLKDPDTEEIDRFNVHLPTIISPELFETVQIKKRNNRIRKDPYSKQTTYLLSKLIKCANCGYSLTPRKRTDRDGLSWVCMSGANGRTNCKSYITITNDKIEPIIWQLVKTELINFSKINRSEREQKVAEAKDKISERKDRIQCYLSNIEGQKALISRAYKAFTNAPEDIVDQAQNDYYETASRCRKEISTSENAIDGLKDEIKQQESVVAYYSSPSLPDDIVERAEADFELKRRLVTELISKIIPHRITTYERPPRFRPNSPKKMTYGVFLLEIHSIDGVFYVFYNANVRSRDRYAYYLTADITYTGSSFATDYVKNIGGERFYLSSPFIYGIEGLDAVISINEFVKIAEYEGNVIPY